MHAHFHNNLHVKASTALVMTDFVNTNNGIAGDASQTILVDETNAALVDENGNALITD